MIPLIAREVVVALVRVVFPLKVLVPENTLLVVVPNAVAMMLPDRVSGYVNDNGDSYEPVKLRVLPDHENVDDAVEKRPLVNPMVVEVLL